GRLDMEKARQLITKRTKLVIAPHVSNVLGNILPIAELRDLARSVGAAFLLDGAQAAGHLSVHVKELGCDAYAFSAHKMYGPMGIGALYVKEAIQKDWRPLLYGGGMVEEVNEEGTRYLEGPRKFEAGTPNVTGAVGFAAACEYIDRIGR